MVYTTINPESCSKVYKEVTSADLLNVDYIASIIIDLWEARGSNCNLDCLALKYCNNKPNRVGTSWAYDIANNLKYKDAETEKIVTAQQSLIKYDTKYAKPIAKSKRKDKSQLNFDF